MTSREYFESARSAQRLIAGRIAAIRSMRSREGLRGQSFEAVPLSGAARDPMRATDSRIDAERDALRELDSYRRDVVDARRVCAGIRLANPLHPLWGDSIELHYLELMGWDEIGRRLGISASCVRYNCRQALDWVDSVGIARAREGVGAATA